VGGWIATALGEAVGLSLEDGTVSDISRALKVVHVSPPPPTDPPRLWCACAPWAAGRPCSRRTAAAVDWALQAREPLLWEHYVVGLLRERLPPTSWKLFTKIRTTFVYADGAMQVPPVAVWSPYPSEPYLNPAYLYLIWLSRTP
jgi:hypothetical protein